MPTERDHLREAVIAGVRDVDAVFRRLTSEVLAIVRRLPSPLDLLGKRRAMRLIDRTLDRVFGLTRNAALTSELFGVIVRSTDATAGGVLDRAIGRVREAMEDVRPGWWQRVTLRPPVDPFTQTVRDLGGSVLDRQRALRAGLLDPNRMWVKGDGTPYRLSDRIWRGGREVRREIDAVLRDGIRKGASAVEVAERLEPYLNPDKAPVSYRKDGRIVRKHQTKTPYGKHGSTYARTLARTEISRVHAVATQRAALETPGVIGLKYALSGSHPAPDSCNPRAEQDLYDLGAGVYPAKECPLPPTHPNCVCHVRPVVAPMADVIAELERSYGG